MLYYDRLSQVVNQQVFASGVFLFFAHRKMPMSSRIGKATPARMPSFRLSPRVPETKPTTVGPPPQPTSPPSASSANMAVPPLGSAEDALLKVPGHMMPTDRPHRAQNTRLSPGTGSSETPR